MKNNKRKGFTLVELVVVIAIMAVLLVVIGVSFNTIFYNKTKAAAKNVYNMIGTAQMLGMSKGNVYLGLSADGNGNASVSIIYGGKTESANSYSVVETKNLGSKASVNVIIDGTNHDITNSYSVMVEIDRTTGGFKNVYAYKATSGDKGGAIGNNMSDIIIGQYDIALVKQTGKYYYKDE